MGATKELMKALEETPPLVEALNRIKRLESLVETLMMTVLDLKHPAQALSQDARDRRAEYVRGLHKGGGE